MGDLSPHFSASEFRSRDGARHPDRYILLHLVAHLEALRCSAGSRPLRIISGYRSPSHNAAVGGARASRHMVGDAVDLPVGYVRPGQAQEVGFRGIGIRDGWAVHVDLRPNPATWQY